MFLEPSWRRFLPEVQLQMILHSLASPWKHYFELWNRPFWVGAIKQHSGGMCSVLGKDHKGTIFGTSIGSWLPSYMPGSQNSRESDFYHIPLCLISSCQDYGGKKKEVPEALWDGCRLVAAGAPGPCQMLAGHRHRALSRCRGGAEMGLNRTGRRSPALSRTYSTRRGGGAELTSSSQSAMTTKHS